MAGEIKLQGKRDKPQAAHRLQLSETAFKALILAIHCQSARDLDICSPRRLLTVVLESQKNRLSGLDDHQLDRLCNHDVVTGRLVINIRIDSCVNVALRHFRETAEHRLGRPVSVSEAIYACCVVASLDQIG